MAGLPSLHSLVGAATFEVLCESNPAALLAGEALARSLPLPVGVRALSFWCVSSSAR